MAMLADAGALDRRDVRAILDAAGLDAASTGRSAGGPDRTRDRRAGLAAGGLTSRQIAATLGVSDKTVGAHVEHVYLKAGVRSRAAATLFAMQHDLVG